MPPDNRSRRRPALIFVLGLAAARAAAAPAPAAAQAAPLTVPGGALRLGLGAGMDSWNDVLPGPGAPVAIDAAQATRLTAELGLAIGLTGRITLTASAPFERYRVQADASDPGVEIPGDRAAGVGDVAVGLAWRVAGTPVDAVRDGPRLEVAAGARLATGSVLQTAEYYTLAAGSGQTEVEVAGRLHLPAGGVGLRLDGAYAVPVGDAASGIERDSYLTVGAAPWLKLSRSLALELVGRQLVRDEAGGGSVTTVGGGLALFARARDRDGRRGLPLAASWRVLKVISAADGAPEPISVTAGVQLYYGLFR